MSYYRELKDYILLLRGGGFFLSPRDIWFLKFLEDEGYPIEVVKEGIRKFFAFHPPEKRPKLPLHMSFGEIKKLRRLHTKKKAQEHGWKEKFLQRLSLAEELLQRKIEIEMPQSVQKAEEILERLEAEIAKRLWESLSKEEKTALFKKFAPFREKEDLFKAMIKRELFKQRGIKGLSLFLD